MWSESRIVCASCLSLLSLFSSLTATHTLTHFPSTNIRSHHQSLFNTLAGINNRITNLTRVAGRPFHFENVRHGKEQGV